VTSLAAALRLAPVWLSPPTLFGLAVGILHDGTRGLFAPLALAAGAALAARLLVPAWPSSLPGGAGTDLGPVPHAWPAPGRLRRPLAVAPVVVSTVFLWAQLAAVRQVAEALGWLPAGLLAAAGTGLALGAWRTDFGSRIRIAGGAVFLAGLVVPLAAVTLATTPWWPRVWDETASRPRIVFSSEGSRTEGGSVLRGPGRPVAFVVTEAQTIRFPGGGSVRLEPWEGGGGRRELASGSELTLRAGDRLTAEPGLRLRFEAGRRVPGAPASGADWVSPPGRRQEGRALAGLGVTLLVGALGLPAPHALLPGTSARAVRLGAGVVVAGVGLVLLWALYAAWVTPQIYVAGVAGVEVYELPASVASLGGVADELRVLALAGLLAGGLSAGLAALPGPVVEGGRAMPLAALAAILLASAFAVLIPVDPWTMVLVAYGLAAATAAPAAVLATWSGRATPTGLASGVVVGFLVFAALTAMAWLDPVGPRPDGSGWLAWLGAWPAVAAIPANALVAWLVSARRSGSARRGSSPDLTDRAG
jgi:hypothetical protein